MPNGSSKEGGSVEDFVKAFPSLILQEANISDSWAWRSSSINSVTARPVKTHSLAGDPIQDPETAKTSGHCLSDWGTESLSSVFTRTPEISHTKFQAKSLSMLSIQELEDPGVPVFPESREFSNALMTKPHGVLDCLSNNRLEAQLNPQLDVANWHLFHYSSLFTQISSFCEYLKIIKYFMFQTAQKWCCI